jgi:two-component system phosphate regulon response regulator OmpR
MTEQVLMIEDDVSLSEMVSEYLAEAGLAVTARHDGASGLSKLAETRFDVVILDVNLPDLDGFEICRRIRSTSAVPIVMLTARGDDTDRIVGLELGADDYLPKPFNPRELLARLRAVLRRSGGEERGTGLLRKGDLEIDCDARIVRRGGVECDLTSYQFDLLRTLVESSGRVLSREQLMQRAGRDLVDAFDRSIDVHISRIRSAIEDDPRHPKRILTVRGTGYVFSRASSEGE